MRRFPCTFDRCAVGAVCGLLLLGVALVFGQTLRHEFINYDDNGYVYDNPPVAHGLTAEGIAWAFTHFHDGNWHPLTWLSHMLDCQLYGPDRPAGHHLTNILLHAANAILLFLLLRRMTGDLWPSALAAALFAIHPLRVESVAWAAERKDVLSGLFFMLALTAYAAYARRGFSLPRYLLVTALFALGLMAKPMLVTLPGVLLLLDYWPLGRAGSREQVAGRREQGGEGREQAGLQSADRGPADGKSQISDFKSQISNPRSPLSALRSPLPALLEKLPWMAMAAASCVVTRFAQQIAISVSKELSLGWRMANGLVSYVAYLGQFFYPAGLAVFYPHPQNGLPVGKIIGSGLLLAGVSLAALACRRKCPYLLVGWLWYLGMLVPVLGLVQVGSQAMADRYTYLAQIGLYVALAWGAERVSRHWPDRCWVYGTISALIVTGLACCAWQQASYWKDNETLWRHTLACTSKNALAHANLAANLAERGEFDEAIDHCREALEIEPQDAMAHTTLAFALAERGNLDGAIAHCQEALRIDPDCAVAHVNLGAALATRGQVDTAIAHYQAALRIRPDYAEAHRNLGAALASRRKFEEAIEQYQMALAIKPGFAEARGNLGDALSSRGRIDEAIIQFQKAVETKPNLAAVHNSLASALAGRGRIDEAIVHFQKVVEIKSDSAEARGNLGACLASRGRMEEAIVQFQKALDIKPDFPAGHSNLAAAYAALGHFDEAVQAARKAVDLAMQQNQPALAESIRAKLKLYEAGARSRDQK